MQKRSIEEKIEDYFKSELKQNDIYYFCKTESINPAIDRALSQSPSKSGGAGRNYPDIKILISTKNNRVIPVMIEVKGTKNKLIKFNSQKQIELVSKDGKYTAIENYAVNGAIHYANAILDEGTYKEVLAIGLNGYEEKGQIIKEIATYYVSEDNARLPIYLEEYTNSLSFLHVKNIDKLINELNQATLSEEQKEVIKKTKHTELEKAVKNIHQKIYDDHEFKTQLATNDKLLLFSGLIMASLSIDGSKDLSLDDLKGNTNNKDHDGYVIINRIESFLNSRNSSKEKTDMIIRLLTQVFIDNNTLWMPNNKESLIKKYYRDIIETISPILKLRINVDFTGIILTSLKDWMNLDNDKDNDVVLTPRYITRLMARLAQTNMNSFVWDSAMGSGGFLISAMELMIEDVKKNISTYQEQEEKIKDIKANQLLGIEILPNIFILAVINMILTGDGSSNVRQGDSFKYKHKADNFPYDVFLLNPPYSASGKGFNFVERALKMMSKGYACILIQENAGSGNGLPYTKEILKHSSLIASIHMPDLFKGKASVQTAIYLFKVNQQHDPQSLVTFIDFSNDGYMRQNRRKSSEEVNLRDIDNAQARYKELEDIILGRKKETDYYNESNNLVVRDTITLEGNDWTFAQHKKIDITPKIEDFKTTVKDYLAWKVSQIIKDTDNDLGKI